MQSIQSTGRFLRPIDQQWVLISEREIRQKIAHAIQYRRRSTTVSPPATTTAKRNMTTSNDALDVHVGVPATLNALESRPGTATTTAATSSSSGNVPNHLFPSSITSYHPPLHYLRTDPTPTFSAAPSEVERYPNDRNDSSIYKTADGPCPDASDQCSPTFGPTLYHHGSLSDMLYHHRTIARHSSVTAPIGGECPDDSWSINQEQWSKSNQRLERSDDVGKQYHRPFRYPSDNVVADSIHHKYDSGPPQHHNAPFGSDHTKLEPSWPPRQQWNDSNHSNAINTMDVKDHELGISTTFDALDVSITSSHETTSHPDLLHRSNVWDQAYVRNTRASPLNIESKFEPSPGAT